MAVQIAAISYIVIAPDLLSGKAPDGGRTSAFKIHLLPEQHSMPLIQIRSQRDYKLSWLMEKK